MTTEHTGPVGGVTCSWHPRYGYMHWNGEVWTLCADGDNTLGKGETK